MQTKRDRDTISEGVSNNNQAANSGQGKGIMLRYGRVGIQSNEEWVYTIKLEKSYGIILNGNCVTLVREYMEALIRVIDSMGHTICLIPYEKGDFETGISDASCMALLEQEEGIYIKDLGRKPQFNHITVKVKIVTSLKLEVLKEPGDWRFAKERAIHLINMWETKIWAQILHKRFIPYLSAVMLIGADPNDDREDIKKELLKKVNKTGHKVKKDSFQIQLRGFRSPVQMKDPRRTMAMMVLVNRQSYADVTKALLECDKKERSKKEYPVTYDVKMEDIRLRKDDVEERYRNAYLSQVQYYLNRVIVKVVGLPKGIDMEKYHVGPEDHGGHGRKTLKQLIMVE